MSLNSLSPQIVSGEAPDAPIRVVLAARNADKTASLGDDTGIDLAGIAEASAFKGEAGQTAVTFAPVEGVWRLVLIGLGDEAELTEAAFYRAGGGAAGKLAKAEGAVEVRFAGGPLSAAQAEAFAEGYWMGAYKYDAHKSKKDDAPKGVGQIHLVGNVASFDRAEALVSGVNMARDLTNEPANHLGPVEMADRAASLSDLGVDVTVLEPDAMEEMGMGALLGVAQGSVRPARLAVMRWNGGGDEAPVAIVGKAVMFDTGGISIKPAGSMEEMKGDMGGGATVVGLMRALAGRKAKANVVGIIGCVENMPDGNAQRPGDVVKAADGQTIEVINTDAEGRLVLADAIWYAQEHVKPTAIVDLATLTGAVMVALGVEHAGLFSNDDTLADRLTKAGNETGDRVWRLPLAPGYDKLIDSKFADMKNVGGRYGGAITAAQFIQRFVAKGMPWAHLDIAGTAISAPQTDTNRSWASGFGVRLLDRWIAKHHEG